LKYDKGFYKRLQKNQEMESTSLKVLCIFLGILFVIYIVYLL